MTRIDLNADMGESYGVWTLGHDLEVLRWVTSANVACGFHAGDPHSLSLTLGAAKSAGVAVGAHPGYPDRVGFGRRFLECSPQEVYADVLYQIGALFGLARAQGIRLTHVKAHGALYNRAALHLETAQAVAQATLDFDSSLPLTVLAGSVGEEVAHKMGLRVRREGFPERAYLKSGQLAPRTLPGSSLHDPQEVAARALDMVLEGRVTALDGGEVKMALDTVCIHGDNRDAPRLAQAVRRALESAGVRVEAPV